MPANDLTHLSFPILKFEKTADGDLVVYGKATDGSIDSDDQIVDQDWSGKAVEEWLKTGGNVRVQHSPYLLPAGKGLEIDVTDDGHFVKSLVVEDQAKKLVEKGVLQAYSVGIAQPKIVRDARAKGGRIVGGRIAEISLVDRPANKNCGITLVKSEELAKAEGGDVWSFGDLSAALEQADEVKAEHADLTKADAADVEKKGCDGTCCGDCGSKKADGADAEKAEPYSKKPGETVECPHCHKFNEPDAKYCDQCGQKLPAGKSEDKADEKADTPDIAKEEAEAELPVQTDDELRAAYKSARKAWLDAEPTLSGAATGTEYLVRKSAWRKWHAEGEAAGLDGTAEGFAAWAAKGELSTDARNDLDDKDFAYVDSKGGRHLPVHDADHVRAALGRFNQTKFEDDESKKKAAGKILARAKEEGVNVSDESTVAQAAKADGVEVTKGAKDCPKCGKTYHADSKQRNCERCGADLPHADSDKDTEVDKGDGRATGRDLPKDTEGAGEHEEPDGDEDGPDVDGDGDGKPAKPSNPADNPSSKKADKPAEYDEDDDEDEDDKKDVEKSDVPYSLKRMHDALCAAYSPDVVLDEYASLKSVADAVDPAFWTEQVSAAVAKGDMVATAALARMAGEAQTLKTADGAAIADARASLHKAFSDLYPDEHLSPSEAPKPGQFKRPYLSAGHAQLTAKPGQTPRVPPSAHTPEPGDFDRGYLSAGHADASPGSSGDNSPVVPGKSARTYYTNGQKEQARSAMQAMHDHIAGTFPDICPMSNTSAAPAPDMGAKSTPKPVTPPASTSGGFKSEEPVVTKAEAPADEEKAPAPDVADLIKSALAEQAAQYEEKFASMRRELDELGSQPDPAQAPVRGVVRKAADAEPIAVERRSLADEAQEKQRREREAYIAYLQKFANSGDPSMREKAYAEIEKLLEK